VHISAKGHTVYADFVVNKNAEFFVVTGNFTTSSKNSVFLADSEVFHNKPVSIYNEIVIQRIGDNNDLDKVNEIIDEKDEVYTAHFRSNEVSKKLNIILILHKIELLFLKVYLF
jgi:hypothetical protein